MSVLRQLTVKDPEDDPSWQLQAQQALELLELRKAEGDLIVASTSIAVCALVALGFAAYLTAFVFSGNYASVSRRDPLCKTARSARVLNTRSAWPFIRAIGPPLRSPCLRSRGR